MESGNEPAVECISHSNHASTPKDTDDLNLNNVLQSDGMRLLLSHLFTNQRADDRYCLFRPKFISMACLFFNVRYIVYEGYPL